MMHKVAGLGLFLAFGALGAAALSGPGFRWGWWSFRQGFTIFGGAAWAGLAAAVLSLVAVVSLARGGGGKGLLPACAGLVLGVALTGWTGNLLRTARSVPAIHDIATDTDAPLEFSAIVPLRTGAANPLDYGGSEVAALQRRAYPDIAPLRSALSPAGAFARARDAARRLGWTIVREDPATGRIEAFDRTFWYGFIDDVVVRVAPAGEGSRIDVRSVSRVGKGDLGVNARRIRKFLRAVAGGS